MTVCACQSTPTPVTPNVGQWYDYGATEPVINGSSFSFPTDVNGTAGYFYENPCTAIGHLPCAGPIAGQTVTLNYDITGNAPVWAQHPQPTGTDGNPASLTLFLWRQGDDLGGGSTGKASYRFWCPRRALLTLGSNQTLSCKLDGSVWTNIAGVIDPNGFLTALANTLGLGFTFGGKSFYGHGVYLSSGSATFKINSFTVK
jgi:hypothetical protein